MSLLNDALKRAKQSSDRDRPPTVPLQPVDYSRQPNPWFQVAVVVLALVALGFSLWFFQKWWTGREQQARETMAEAPSPAVASPTIVTPAETPAPEPKAVRPKILVNTNIVVRTNFIAGVGREAAAETPAARPVVDSAGRSTNAAATNRVPVVEPAPSPAVVGDLRLLSIIFREDKPAAVINGEMVRVGEEVRGARVIRIEPHAVTLERSGSNLVLRLPRL